jgi:DNA-binding IscR family transcriptional regulator
MRDQLALQAMVNIARGHDGQSGPEPSLENLAVYQQVPVDVLKRMLDALETDDLIQQSADDPPRYLPGSSIQRIRLVDILRSARQAEDEGHTDSFRSDAPVSALLLALEQNLESHLADKTLADLLQNFEDEAAHEDSLV